MLDTADIDARLREMRDQPDPRLLWDENCGGSARAIVVFVGPSPGGKKAPERRPLNRTFRPALWNESFTKPLESTGFRTSFSPLVEAIFSTPDDYDTASKLIVKANLDWICDPDAGHVPERFMHEGARSVLQMLEDCAPDLVLPMEKIAFRVLKDVMQDAGFTLAECPVKQFYVRLNAVAAARTIFCFRATSKGRSLVVIKLPQHPARMYQPDLATRCGKAVRAAAQQIAAGQPVDVMMS